MAYSEWQNFHSENLYNIFSSFGIELYAELHIHKNLSRSVRIDLGSKDFKYGVEIKSGMGDLKTGCGLNQELFAYGYVVCPEKIAPYVIGYLFLNDMNYTGVISWDGERYEFLKPARFNPNSFCEHMNLAEELLSLGDIGHLIEARKHNQQYELEEK